MLARGCVVDRLLVLRNTASETWREMCTVVDWGEGDSGTSGTPELLNEKTVVAAQLFFRRINVLQWELGRAGGT